MKIEKKINSFVRCSILLLVHHSYMNFCLIVSSSFYRFHRPFNNGSLIEKFFYAFKIAWSTGSWYRKHFHWFGLLRHNIFFSFSALRGKRVSIELLQEFYWRNCGSAANDFVIYLNLFHNREVSGNEGARGEYKDALGFTEREKEKKYERERKRKKRAKQKIHLNKRG